MTTSYIPEMEILKYYIWTMIYLQFLKLLFHESPILHFKYFNPL